MLSSLIKYVDELINASKRLIRLKDVVLAYRQKDELKEYNEKITFVVVTDKVRC